MDVNSTLPFYFSLSLSLQDISNFAILVTLRYLVENMGLPSGLKATTMYTLLVTILLLSLVNVICATNGKRMILIVEMRIKMLLSTMIYRKVRIHHILSHNKNLNDTESLYDRIRIWIAPWII